MARCLVSRLFVTLLLLCTPLSNSYEIVSREATQDNTIISNELDLNCGSGYQLKVGHNPGVFLARTLINFDLNGFQGRRLSKICLILYVSEVSSAYTRCTEWGWPPPFGCATAHLITGNFWAEGANSKSDEPIVTGESSWRYRNFPSQWNSQGGDFQSEPIGNLIPEPSGSIEAHFILNTERMQAIIDNPDNFRGFLLMDDDNTGYFTMESRECSSSSGSSECPHMMGKPRIELEFFTEAPSHAPTRQPTSPPTPSPTRQPTRQPTRAPTRQPSLAPTRRPTVKPTQAPTLQPTLPPTRRPTGQPTRPPTGQPSVPPTRSPTELPTFSPTSAPADLPTSQPVEIIQAFTGPPVEDIATTAPTTMPVMNTFNPTLMPSSVVEEESCGRFRQNVTLLQILTPTTREQLERLIEDYIAGLSPEYIADTSLLTTTVMVNDFTESESSENGAGPLIVTEYTLCFRQPLNVTTTTQLEIYPMEYATYMSLTSSRVTFESFLSSQGIPVQALSLTPPELINVADNIVGQIGSGNQGGNDSERAIIIGVSSALGALVMVGALLFLRRQTARRNQSTPVIREEDEDLGTRGATPIFIALPVEERVEEAAREVENLQYKDQGESRPEEASHQHGPAGEKHDNESDYDV